jgi:hypothetical protein
MRLIFLTTEAKCWIMQTCLVLKAFSASEKDIIQIIRKGCWTEMFDTVKKFKHPGIVRNICRLTFGLPSFVTPY